DSRRVARCHGGLASRQNKIDAKVMAPPASSRVPYTAWVQGALVKRSVAASLSNQPEASNTPTTPAQPPCHHQKPSRSGRRGSSWFSTTKFTLVTRPARARWAWATSALVNLSRSETPGRKLSQPVSTSRPHHTAAARSQGRQP